MVIVATSAVVNYFFLSKRDKKTYKNQGSDRVRRHTYDALQWYMILKAPPHQLGCAFDFWGSVGGAHFDFEKNVWRGILILDFFLFLNDFLENTPL